MALRAELSSFVLLSPFVVELLPSSSFGLLLSSGESTRKHTLWPTKISKLACEAVGIERLVTKLVPDSFVNLHSLTIFDQSTRGKVIESGMRTGKDDTSVA